MKPMPRWEEESVEICKSVAQRKGVLKLILKTKDDPFFLTTWIDHHCNIVGAENIVIFDNMSTDERVLNTYRNLPSDIVVCQYAYFHNFIHIMSLFQALYNSLSLSSTYFAVLDTDEFLTLIDSNFFVSSKRIPDFLEQRSSLACVPATWLHNGVKSRTLFRIGTVAGLVKGLQWGKPILNSQMSFEGIINHNVEVPKRMFDASTPTNIFLLHMTSLFPMQRIEANIRKLVARKYASVGESLQAILQKDREAVEDNNIIIYLREIEDILRWGDHSETTLTAHRISLRDEESLAFFGEAEKELMHSFLSSNRYEFIKRAFGEESDGKA